MRGVMENQHRRHRGGGTRKTEMEKQRLRAERIGLAGQRKRNSSSSSVGGVSSTDTMVGVVNAPTSARRRSSAMKSCTARVNHPAHLNNQKGSHRQRQGVPARSQKNRVPERAMKPAETIRSLFSPIQYQCSSHHKYTNEALPNVPAPWTKLDPPSAKQQPIAQPEGCEEGEVYEAALEPNPLLKKLDSLPFVLTKSRPLQYYIHKVKSYYMDGKNLHMKWMQMRKRFENVNFQALVNDYLADCQMRRDRGEIADHEFHLHTDTVMNLLFMDQVTVQNVYMEGKDRLDSLWNSLVALKEVVDASGHLDDTMVQQLIDSHSSQYSGWESEVDLQQSLNELGHFEHAKFEPTSRGARLRSPEPVHNAFSNAKVTLSEIALSSDEGLQFLRSQEERLRLSRALDQRVPFTRRQFNGKLCTFEEARRTDCSGYSCMDRSLLKSSDPVVQNRHMDSDEEGGPSLQIGDTIVIDHRSDDSSDGVQVPLIMEKFWIHCQITDEAYRNKIDRFSKFADRELTTPQYRGLYQQNRHVLFGTFPSAGRKKYSDEEDMDADSDDDDSYSSRQTRRPNNQQSTSKQQKRCVTKSARPCSKQGRRQVNKMSTKHQGSYARLRIR